MSQAQMLRRFLIYARQHWHYLQLIPFAWQVTHKYDRFELLPARRILFCMCPSHGLEERHGVQLPSHCLRLFHFFAAV
jgi:hypothetical protein